MPLNPKTVRARAEPTRSARIDKHYRCPLPREIPWTVGMRVFFSPIKADARGGSPGVVISKKPKGVRKGRLLSARVHRFGRSPLAKMRHKPLRCRPRRPATY